MSRACRRVLAATLLVASSPIAWIQAVVAQTAPGADIVVTPTRTDQPLARAGSAITVITAEEIDTSSAKDVGELFRRVPGVSLTQSGGPGRVETVRIRGGDVRHTLVLVDGIRVNDPSSTGREFDFSSLVLADIARIEVLRGPQSALYGSDAMGGVINIITKRGRGAPKANLSVEAGRYGSKEIRAGLSGGDDRVDYSFGVAGFDTAGFSSYGYRIPRLRYTVPWGLEPDAAQRFGFTGRVGVNVAEGVRIELGGTISANRAQYDAAFLPYPDTPSRADSRLYDIYGRLIADSFDNRLRSTVTLFANRTDRRDRGVFYFGFDPTLPPTAFRTDTTYRGDRVGAEYQGDLKLGALGILTLGARVEREAADSFSRDVLPVPGPDLRTIAAEQTTASLFAIHQITLADRLHLSLGGRLDDITSPDRLLTGLPGSSPHAVDRFGTWRATLAYEIPETETKLRASIGTGAKTPSLFQLYSPSYGTPTLDSERSVGIDAGIDQSLFDGRVRLSATGFYNRYKDLIDFNADPLACRPGQFFGCYYNVARAEMSGFEFDGTVALVRQVLDLRLTYTLLDARDLATDLRLARRPENTGRIGLVWTPIPRLSIEPSVVFVGERYDLPGQQGKLPPYARLDLYASYRLDDTVTVYLRGENLTNTRYEEVRGYGTSGTALYGGIRATW